MRKSLTAASLFFISVLSALFFTACKTPPVITPGGEISIQQIHRSILYERYTIPSSAVEVHLITVDLSDPEISISTSPAENAALISGKTPEWLNAESTAGFAERTKSIVAVNATPFKYYADSRLFFFIKKQKPVGIFISDGQLISKPQERYGALCFTKDKTAYVQTSQTDELREDTETALGGFFVTLKDGSFFGEWKEIYDSRTAAGISKDGKTLYILCAEGKNSARNGLTFYESTAILKEKGAWTVIQMDGGSSTSLFINGKIAAGTRRPAVNHLGIVLESGEH